MKFTQPEIETLERMAAEGRSLDAIAAALGRSRGSVQERCRRTGLTFPRKRLLSDDQVEQFKLMARVGHSGVAIARTLGLKAEQVRKLAVRYGVSLRQTCATRNKIRCAIDPEAHDVLDQEAARRGEPLSRFCRMLLEAVAYSRLCDAVIDQQPTKPPRERRYGRRPASFPAPRPAAPAETSIEIVLSGVLARPLLEGRV